MASSKMKVKQGDTVMVISGKNKGKKGKVLRAVPGERRVVVEGVNKVKRHQKPTQAAPQGGIMETEAPFDASNVMVVCNKCSSPVRVGKKQLESGDRVRYCKKCGHVLD